MARQKTSSFIIELPLTLTKSDEAEAIVRLDLARKLFNACLDEALRRLDLMRESRAWQATGLLHRKSQKNERKESFKLLNHQYGFLSASISAFGTQCKNEAQWNDHLGAHETQRIAERAFHAVEEHCFGKRGRPRFKGKFRPLHSMEGKSSGSGLKWNKEIGCLQWSGMFIPAMLPTDSKDPYLAEAMHARTKYARIVWRTINGKRRWFAQLIQEGQAPRKYAAIENEIVGLDVGPSTIAVYSENGVALLPLCPEIDQPWSQVKRLQRAMANKIIALGNVIKTEQLSYKALQKNFGRSTKVRAIGAMMATIQRKAESAGGEFIELNTWRLKMSQYDHLTKTYTKKKLSQRWHILGDGSGVVQRDMYSAFLAANAAGDVIHHHQVTKAWSTAQLLLARAGWMQPQSVSVASLLATAPTLRAPERIARERVLVTINAKDVVELSTTSINREPLNACESALRTP